ncbi:hypothetical protein Taro_012242 [Colocasia esculenta]|uniref:AAA+ ATPase domain-containing protein n=1 Tax=Colocasia esculenta TaxID=4460 RepID=A0A843U8H4_COLES|nr:hypothetical protein [Colocasia esculenta]
MKSSGGDGEGCGGSTSPSAAGEGGGRNWRQEADENLRRLHSLLFGCELALERGDAASAQVLGFRLLGFLDSRTESPVDAAFVAPIRAEAYSKIEAARRSLAPESDRKAFEQARRDEGKIFVKRGGFDVEKVVWSQNFQRLLKETNNGSAAPGPTTLPLPKLHASHGSAVQDVQDPSRSNELDMEHEILSVRVSKVLTQAKLTTMYGNKVSRPSNTSYKKMLSEGSTSDDCAVEKAKSSSLNYPKSHSSVALQVEDDDGPCVITLKPKRRHVGFTSPECEAAISPSSKDDPPAEGCANRFVTARTKLEMDSKQKQSFGGSPSAMSSPKIDANFAGNTRNYGMKSNGIFRRGVRGNFVPPMRSSGGNGNAAINSRGTGKCDDTLEDSTRKCLEMLCGPDGELPEKLRNLEPRLIEHVSNEIMDRDPNVRWDDIAGLEHAKKCVTEMVIWPLLRPDIFRGCRSPGRGLLLFGPPGTGKTMIGKAIAGEAKATFFYISASSLTSKWIGEGEKLVRALFGVASCRQPAVIFVDEIDSLLSQRKSEGEHESSRRLKTQFLIEMEGFDSGNEQILLIGATNRPQELDEAARRRLTKRLYIPLPSSEARAWIIRNLLEKDGLFKLSDEDTAYICKLTEGYSGSDMKNLVKDASMGPLREALSQGINITKIQKEDMRPVMLQSTWESPTLDWTGLDWSTQHRGGLALPHKRLGQS